MTGRKPTGDGHKTREERLAAALRANLRRRKAAARAPTLGDNETGKAQNSADFRDKPGPFGRRS
jgi:hypothetical protein